MIHVASNEADLVAIVRDARAARRRLAIAGAGTRAGLSAPRAADETISTQALTGVLHYNPAEMTVTAQAGTPLAELEAVVADKGQMLPFEPGDPRVLYGANGAPTIGGMIAAGFSGPRRVLSGSLRDALLGMRLVNGRAEAVGWGGRVMKNVTGLDLARLQVGALGRYGVLTQATFRLLPHPPARATLVLEGLDDATAIRALSAALATPFEVSGAAHWPERGLTALRVERDVESVAYRTGELASRLKAFGAARPLEQAEAAAFWRDVADLAPFGQGRARWVWRVATAPSRAARIVADVTRVTPMRALYDWGGGLVHLACECDGAACVAAIRRAVGAEGSARLILGPHADVPPLADPAAALKRRIAQAFDPDGVFDIGAA
jgi:glycolate oxidase FAD binding subunit